MQETTKVKIKVPDKIQVGGHWFKIRYDNHVRDSGRRGELSYQHECISIDPSRPWSSQESALVHEILHFVNAIYCRNVLEEDVIDPMAEGIYQALTQLGIKFNFSDIKHVKHIYNE